MEARHGVVEMRRMGIARLVSRVDILELGLRMSHGGKDTFRCDILAELHGAGEFGGSIPSLDAVCLLEQGDILFGVRVLDIFRHLSTRHLEIEIMPLEVETQDRAIRFCHQLFCRFGCRTNHRNRRRRKCWENTCRPMLHVSGNRGSESILRTFHEIASATSVDMYFHSAGNNIHTFGVDKGRANNRQVAVRNFEDFVVSNEYRTIFKPSLWRQDKAVDNLE